MKAWWIPIATWWNQRQLEALHQTLKRQGLWGVHTECLTELKDLIRPLMASRYSAETLKHTQASLHASSIDYLTSDLYRMADTIRQEAYVDERLAYISTEPRSLHAYLTHRDGYAVPVQTAFDIFHAQALEVAYVIDALAESEEEDVDSHYYTRRYRGILEETLAVYALFARLVGLAFPHASGALAQVAS